jgi:hypothetical protein
LSTSSGCCCWSFAASLGAEEDEEDEDDDDEDGDEGEEFGNDDADEGDETDAEAAAEDVKSRICDDGGDWRMSASAPAAS